MPSSCARLHGGPGPRAALWRSGAFSQVSSTPGADYSERELRCLHSGAQSTHASVRSRTHHRKAGARCRHVEIDTDPGFQSRVRRDDLRFQLRCRMQHALSSCAVTTGRWPRSARRWVMLTRPRLPRLFAGILVCAHRRPGVQSPVSRRAWRGQSPSIACGSEGFRRPCEVSSSARVGMKSVSTIASWGLAMIVCSSRCTSAVTAADYARRRAFSAIQHRPAGAGMFRGT